MLKEAASPHGTLFAIVEDDPFMAQLVSDMLTSGGVHGEVFMHGLDLFKCGHLDHFEAIILDLSLTDTDSFDLMDKLAAELMGLSVVLMSGHELGVIRAAEIYGKGVGLQVRGALTKPFTKDALFAALGLPL